MIHGLTSLSFYIFYFFSLEVQVYKARPYFPVNIQEVKAANI